MWFRRLFRGRQKPVESEASTPLSPQEAEQKTINQGIQYFYMIMGAQIFLVLGLVGLLTVFGTVLATPLWVYLGTLGLGVAGTVYIYRKIKAKFLKFRDAFKNVNLSNSNYEISFMGGVFTMRVEQHPRALLEAPAPSQILEAETVEPPAAH